jgi:putative addiction module component (TIGR02574 family)
MSLPAKVVESEALDLSRRERSRLIVRLLDSLDERPEGDPAVIEKAWLQEAVRRYEAYVRGEEAAVPAEQVFGELRDRLN